MKNKGSILAGEIDEENKREKAIKELLKCKNCIHFDKEVYKCKEKECKDGNSSQIKQRSKKKKIC